MAIQRKTKVLNLARTARQYLAEKSETEIARMLRLRGRIGSGRKKSGRRLSASCIWQKWELKLLGKIPDEEVARRTGRTFLAVRNKRKKLRILQVNTPHKGWRDWERKLLGKYSDKEVARRTGRTVVATPRIMVLTMVMRRCVFIKCNDA